MADHSYNPEDYNNLNSLHQAIENFGNSGNAQQILDGEIW